ncbi:MAG: methyltransferase domain-containing protein [Alphaproteobacteria bacterium]|nr:methyltransferase domain-containing protein [Alphaproteobacteria bacterium]
MLPSPLILALQEISKIYHFDVLRKKALEISEVYRLAERTGTRLVTDKASVFSYALTRMPATFEVVNRVLEFIPEQSYTSVLDVGAGTGAATWAFLAKKDIHQAVCLEREPEMLRMGADLMENAFPFVEWKLFDLVNDDMKENADIVLTSYVLNELAPSERLKAVDKLWNVSNKVLVVIDNGTPEAFEMMKKIRTYLIEKGAFLVAPCSHDKVCQNNWCHFSTRVQRTKEHKDLKNAQAPYEDEKFTYLIFSKTFQKCCNARILRHPKIEKGKITFQLCTSQGITEQIISKKDKELFKKAKKLKTGDVLI